MVPKQELERELELELELEQGQEREQEPHPKVMVAQPLATPEVPRIQELVLSLVLEPTVERELGQKQETAVVLE
jgi:hypothetical protein